MQIFLLKSLARKGKQVWVVAQEEVKDESFNIYFGQFVMVGGSTLDRSREIIILWVWRNVY